MLHTAVFEEQIWKFFKEDVESCFEASDRARTVKGGKGGQNFTAALVILTVIDFCAGFYVGKLQPSRSDIGEFMAKYLGNYYEPFKNTDFCESFYVVFRHGLVHQWSPKFSGIAMDFDNIDILSFSGKHPVLNVPPFFDMVCKGLNDYEDDLDEHEELRKKFELRHAEIMTKDESEAEVLITLSKSS